MRKEMMHNDGLLAKVIVVLFTLNLSVLISYVFEFLGKRLNFRQSAREIYSCVMIFTVGEYLVRVGGFDFFQRVFSQCQKASRFF